MELKDKLKSGLKLLDEQHCKVLDLLATIKKSIETNASKDDVLLLIGELDFYITYHFDFEEEIASGLNFYRLDDMKSNHDDFRTSYRMFKRVYEPSKHNVAKVYALHIASFMQDWVDVHFEYVESEFIELVKKSIADGKLTENYGSKD